MFAGILAIGRREAGLEAAAASRAMESIAAAEAAAADHGLHDSSYDPATACELYVEFVVEA